ncbi:MAG: hypothetical protein ABJP33_02440 [Pseudoruegeria sp.]
MGSAAVALFQNVLSHVPDSDAGAGSCVLQAFLKVGAVLGIALISQIFFLSLGSETDQDAYHKAAKNSLLMPITVYVILAIFQFFKLSERGPLQHKK